MIHAICPQCQQESEAPDHRVGKVLNCPRCGTKMLLPQTVEPPEPIKTPAHDNYSAAPDPLIPPRRKSDHTDLIDMTAMVDIVFFLLIYFLVTSFVAMSAAIHAPLTEGRVATNASASQSTLPSLTVRIDADDAIWIEQDPVFGPTEVYSRLKSAQLESGAEKLRIAASPEATHGKLVMVLDAGLSAGFKSAQVGLEDIQ